MRGQPVRQLLLRDDVDAAGDRAARDGNGGSGEAVGLGVGFAGAVVVLRWESALCETRAEVVDLVGDDQSVSDRNRKEVMVAVGDPANL